jgi:hypothetical protein
MEQPKEIAKSLSSVRCDHNRDEWTLGSRLRRSGSIRQRVRRDDHRSYVARTVEPQ